MEDNKIKFQKISTILRGLLGSSDFEKNIICLLFLKYSMDNKLFSNGDNQNNNSLSALIDLQNAILRNYEVIPAIHKYLLETFSMIKFNNFDFTNELYGVYEKIAMLDMTNDGKIFQSLMSIDLRDSSEELLYYIEHLITSSGRRIGEYISNSSLVELSIKLLDPKENEICYDPFVGCGSFVSKLPNNVSALGQDIDYAALIVATIRCILSKKIDINYSFVRLARMDTFNEIDDIKADCVFSEGPINLQLKNPNLSLDQRFSILSNLNLDSNIASILNAIYSLKTNGRAVIAIPAGVLSKTLKSYNELRKILVESNLIESIIELPPMWNTVSVQTYLLFLRKNKNNNKITFVSAGNNDYYGFTTKVDSRNTFLTIESICKLTDIVINKVELPNISKNVSIDEIEKESFNLNVNRYVDLREVKEYRSVIDINRDIEKVKEEIIKNLDLF